MTLWSIQIDHSNWKLQKLFFSVKHKEHELKYEIEISPLTGYLHWIARGVLSSIHDLTLVTHSGLLNHLHDEEHIYGDKAYIGNPFFITLYKGKPEDLNWYQNTWNTFINHHRVKVENVIGRMKNFKALSTPWHHDLSLHPVAFTVVTQLVALDMYKHPIR